MCCGNHFTTALFLSWVFCILNFDTEHFVSQHPTRFPTLSPAQYPILEPAFLLEFKFHLRTSVALLHSCNAHTLLVTLNQMHVTVGLLCCIKRINTQRKEVSKFHRLFYVMTHMSGARVQQAGCNCDFANICAKYLALT